jgi:hypothetical protein
MIDLRPEVLMVVKRTLPHGNGTSEALETACKTTQCHNLKTIVDDVFAMALLKCVRY